MYKIFKKYCKKIKYVDISRILKLIIGLIFTGKITIDGLNSGKQIEKLINKVCNKKNIYQISDIKMPLIIPSVDMCDGKVICFTSKDTRKDFSDDTVFVSEMNIGKAVKASCSYPGVFSPCGYRNTKLIDGGIRQNIPWKEAKLFGADKVLNIALEDEINEECCKNLIDVSVRAINLLCRELSNYELEGADYTLKIQNKKVGLLDMSKIDELYETGYQQMKENCDMFFGTGSKNISN